MEYVLREKKGESLRCFKRSLQALEDLDSDVPAVAWRHFLLNQHKRFVEGKEKPLYALHEKTQDRSFAHLIEAALSHYSEATPIKALRGVSPA
jgi:hypothetical protein